MIDTIIVTGSAGLVGSSCVRYYAARGYRVIGIDNDMRGRMFGDDASVADSLADLVSVSGYEHCSIDIRDREAIDALFRENKWEIAAIIHCAAQPSHDWAAGNPFTDFEINAAGTLNLLEATRNHCPKSPFLFMSTNKVYGDYPNNVVYIDTGSRFEPANGDGQNAAIKEFTFPVDQCKHSLFGCSKLAADLYVQEYGRYFGMNTVCFRGGCLTGPAHAGTKLHGFLSYLVRCCVTETPYEVIGYGGKQVRDNIHSDDLVRAFDCYIQNPRPGAVYNIGGGRQNSCSILEAVQLAEEITGNKMTLKFTDEPRIGDHKWWITDNGKFQRDYPGWKITKSLRDIVEEIAAAFTRKAAT